MMSRAGLRIRPMQNPCAIQLPAAWGLLHRVHAEAHLLQLVDRLSHVFASGAGASLQGCSPVACELGKARLLLKWGQSSLGAPQVSLSRPSCTLLHVTHRAHRAC